MRRGLWFVAGAGSAVYAMVRARRAAEVFTIDGLQDRLGALGVGARMFRDEVAQGQAEKESELRERLGLVPHGTPELTGGRHKAVSTSSTRADSSTHADSSNHASTSSIENQEGST